MKKKSSQCIRVAGPFSTAILLLAASVFNGLSDEAQNNCLTEEEKAAGWKLLFDGKTTQGWRSFGKQSFPEKGWVIEEACLRLIRASRPGDIMSNEQFQNFDLQWEWRLPAKANNGIKYFITEERGTAIGHEYQMVDDNVKKGKESTASFYDVLAPDADKPLNPPGNWNHSRVLVKGSHVEHWLNGKKVLEYELGSEQLKQAIANSKFKTVEGFGTSIKGHILLTDHHDEVWFRNIKIRELE